MKCTAERLIEEGELKGKLETATRMLEFGTDIEFVQKMTGLSLAEIKKLKSSKASS